MNSENYQERHHGSNYINDYLILDMIEDFEWNVKTDIIALYLSLTYN